METRPPLVSVAMPVYNVQRTVAAAIRSILGQTFTDWELLIVNDGSTDETIDVVRCFRDPRIRVWSDDRNLGLSVRLNETIQQSRGRYYARMDGDDVAYPQRLERQLAFMQANPDLDLVGAWILVFGEDGVPLGKRTARLEPDSHNVLRTIPVGHPTFLGKLDWFRQRRYMSSVRFIQDQQLLLQAIEQGRIGVVPEILLGYREEALTIRKQVRYRWEYVKTSPDMVQNLGAWRTTALLVIQLLKLGVDVVAIGTGLNYRILRHRAEPATEAEQQEWQSVWESVSRGPEGNRPGVCWVVSSPLTIRAFLRNHLARLSGEQDVTIVANGERKDAALGGEMRVAWVRTRLERKVHPLLDSVALLKLCREFRSRRFMVVQSVTPKAGLLAMTAAWLTRVPIRVHWFTGQVWCTRSGLARASLKLVDRWIARASTHLLVDSPSQRRFLIEERVASADKMTVLAEGSICGVDEQRFRPDPVTRAAVREQLGIQNGTLVFLFVGRCTLDKGLLDLAEAFDELCRERDDAYLIVCGPDEDSLVPRMAQRAVRAGKRLVYCGHTSRPEDLMAAADVLCLPSYREGFGQVVIEAAAVGLPCIASRIYGLVDAVDHGVTGFLHEPHSPGDILDKMRAVAQDPLLRLNMGKAARFRAVGRFNQRVVTQALVDYYGKILGTCPAEVPSGPSTLPPPGRPS